MTLTPGPAAAASLITGFKAGVLTDENTSNPEEKDYATQAGSHPDVAFTNFSLNTLLNAAEFVRVDLPPGLSVNPQAIPRCTYSGLELESKCASDTQVGKAKIKVVVLGINAEASGKVYNMTPSAGSPGEFAFAVTILGLVTVRTNLVAGLRYYPSGGQPGDYGEYFTISEISSAASLALSELDFWGAPEEHNGGGATNNAFLTNPTLCAGPQTTNMFARTYGGLVSEGTDSFTTPVGASGCSSVPFSPTVAVTPSTTQRDKPDALALDVHVPQDQTPSHIASSQLREAQVKLPEGVSLNPSAANGLQACTEAQFGEGTNNAITCPAASEVGTAEITSPALGEALAGKLYVATPKSEAPESGEEYRLFLAAENATVGVKVRLTGSVAANATSGQLTATFANTPQLPFTDIKLNFNGGAKALFANPLGCGGATTDSTLTPYSGNAAATPSSVFTVDNNGSGGSCAATVPFAPAATATLSSKVAGAPTNLTLNVTRADGEGILSGVTMSLPEGMLANLNSVSRLCSEAQAAEAKCPAESLIGSASVSAGAGTEPLTLAGSVYLTTAYKGGQFGLAAVVPANAGPYRLGNVIARAAVSLNTSTGQLTVTTDPLPTIVGGVPLRLRNFKLEITKAGLLMNATNCATSAISGSLTSTAAQTQPFSSAVHLENCGSLPFAPTLQVTPSTTSFDSPLGLTVAIRLSAGSADLHNAVVTLPEGVTLNPAVANGLEACTDAQLGLGTNNPVGCPASSIVGSAEFVSPLLPTPLSGSIYIGQPLNSNPESGEEYRVFVAAKDPTYGISVRLVGALSANAGSGRLTATFANTPPMPFTETRLTFNGGEHAALASPEACGTATTGSALQSSTGAEATPTSAYTVDANGGGEACAPSIPFTPTLAVTPSTLTAGAFDPLTLGFESGDREQKLGSLAAQLPPGLIGEIASVPTCPEPAAAQGTCGAESLIGSATATLGLGTSPLALSGRVYLTGPYEGAPFGLSVVVPAIAGPYNLGTVVVRARIAVDPNDAHLTITSGAFPTMLASVPLRLKGLALAIERAGFMLNPTSCASGAVAATVLSSVGSSQLDSSPFQSTGCGGLPFAPVVSGTAIAASEREDGASLNVELAYPSEHEANLSGVSVSLPAQLVARVSTLGKACLESAFNANPAACPAAAKVGEASVSTPVLPGAMSGPVYLVATGGAAFPKLAVTLSGDGVTLNLHGQTAITSGITSATFSGLPDVPIKRFSLSLPQGPSSLLAVNGSLCGGALTMPATLSAQNGAQLVEHLTVSAPMCAAASAGSGGSGGSGNLSALAISPSHFAAAGAGGSVARKAVAGAHRRARGNGHAPVGATVSFSATGAGRVSFVLERKTVGRLRGRRCVAGPPTGGSRAKRRRCVRYAKVAVRRALAGEMRGGRCAARLAGAHHGRRCTRTRRVSSFSLQGVAGANSFRFSGRLAGERLAPGAYRLVAGASGSRATQSVPFWILRG